jgi:hypothetical protein
MRRPLARGIGVAVVAGTCAVLALAVSQAADQGLDAQSGGTVQGTVVDSTGAPVPGAGITLLVDASGEDAEEAAWTPVAQGVTDTGGAWVVTDVPSGEYLVHVDGGPQLPRSMTTSRRPWPALRS